MSGWSLDDITQIGLIRQPYSCYLITSLATFLLKLIVCIVSNKARYLLTVLVWQWPRAQYPQDHHVAAVSSAVLWVQLSSHPSRHPLSLSTYPGQLVQSCAISLQLLRSLYVILSWQLLEHSIFQFREISRMFKTNCTALSALFNGACYVLARINC